MAAHTKAAVRTLKLPEIVAEVVSFLMYDIDTLAVCMRINEVFQDNAARHLWKRCGSGTSCPTEQGNWVLELCPKIRHLAALAPNPDRLQWYARHIRYLQFGVEVINNEHHSSDDSRDEALYHAVFRNVLFPRLEVLCVDGNSSLLTHNNDLALLQYVQSNLRSCILTGVAISDQFLSKLRNHCSQLQRLHLCGEEDLRDSGMSEKGVVELIQAMPALQEFYAHRSIRSIWSIEVFLAIGMHQILGSLELPNIPDHWISILTDQYEGRFARLVSLSTGLSEAGLEMLVPHLPEVTVLSLSMVGSSHRVLRTIATSFPDLSYLNLVLRSDDVIREQDLILLADNSPSLSGLGLFSEEADSMIRANIGSDGITNATINDLARRVPKLRNLSLYLGDAALTEQSLVFLGAHCKMLGTIYISADVDFETLVGDDHRNWFPELHQLDILPPPSDRRRYAHPDRVARQLREAAPKLRGLIVGFSNLDPSEAVLKDMFDGLVRGG